MPTRSSLRSALALLLLAGCSTDLDINAPYKNITVVYALLSTNDNAGAGGVHFVKINKAFLGEGDAFVYAEDPDSNQYTNDQLVARVEEISNGQVTNSWSLNDSLIDDRDPGTFFSPEHILYYFTADLDPDREYRVVADVRGERVEAVTPLVNDFSVNTADANPATKIGLKLSSGYTNWELNWTTGPDGRRYETYYRFNYAEVRGTDTTFLSFTRLMGTRVSSGTSGSEPMSATILGENFFIGVANLVQPDPTVDKRIFYDLDLIWQVASDEFHTYLTLQEPLTGIVEERPDYTNLTNGYGLVASRFRKQVTGKRLSDESLLELVQGQYTGNLQFCSFYSSPGSPAGCN